MRELFRNLHLFQSVYETDSVEEIICPDGMTWNLFDLSYLYEEGLPLLPTRQWQAIELCLVRNVKESDAAEMMGLSRTNPVAMYATKGLMGLITMIEDGRLPRFRMQPSWDPDRMQAAS